MNDRLKYRVWCKSLEKYVDNVNLSPKGIVFYSRCFFNADNRDYIIEQCTGLKDKNENLIYEGDVIKCDRDFSENGRKNLIRKVIFADGSFQLERAKTIGDRYYINAFHNFEIIGNIHKQAEQKDK